MTLPTYHLDGCIVACDAAKQVGVDVFRVLQVDGKCNMCSTTKRPHVVVVS